MRRLLKIEGVWNDETNLPLGSAPPESESAGESEDKSGFGKALTHYASALIQSRISRDFRRRYKLMDAKYDDADELWKRLEEILLQKH